MHWDSPELNTWSSYMKTWFNVFLPISCSACNQAGLGVGSIFGPRSAELAQHINSMCNNLEIPHLEARLEPKLDPTHLFSMNLYPAASQLSQAYLDLIKLMKWKKFCVIYGDQSGGCDVWKSLSAEYQSHTFSVLKV